MSRSRLPVRKTYKLFIGGAFPRSESGRTLELEGHNVARASRKDARDAVVAARKAFAAGARRPPTTAVRCSTGSPRRWRRAWRRSRPCAAGGARSRKPIDRVVWYAGWADKLAQVLGGANPVAGPYFNFTVPEPTGVVAVVAPGEPALDGLVARLVPALVGGNAVVVVASEAHPLAAIELAEAIATSDVPAGVVNVLTGPRRELAPVLAAHMDVNAIDVTGADGDVAALEVLAAENVKRVVRAREDRSPWEIARVHGAEDGLAPDRALIARSPRPEPRIRRGFLWGTPTHHPLPILIGSVVQLATTPCQLRADFVTRRGLSRRASPPASIASTAPAAASSRSLELALDAGATGGRSSRTRSR